MFKSFRSQLAKLEGGWLEWNIWVLAQLHVHCTGLVGDIADLGFSSGLGGKEASWNVSWHGWQPFLLSLGSTYVFRTFRVVLLGVLGGVDNLGGGGSWLSWRTEGGEVGSLPGAGFGFSLVHTGSCFGVLKVLEDRSFLIVWVGGGDITGTYLCRNFQLQRVTRP